MPEIPRDEIMQQLTKMAIEWATTYFAEQAERAAQVTSRDISGPEALRAFARAIRNTNAKRFGELST